MPVRRTRRPGDLEPIETASRDELAALQLERLQWSLAHAYEHVPHYRRKFDAAGVHPATSKSLADLAQLPVHDQGRTCATTTRSAMFAVPREQVVRIHASSGTTGKPTVVGYTREGHRHVGDGDGALDPRGRRPRRRHRPRRLRLRPLHRRPRRALRRRAARLRR